MDRDQLEIQSKPKEIERNGKDMTPTEERRNEKEQNTVGMKRDAQGRKTI